MSDIRKEKVKVSKGRRCNLDGQPISEADQEQTDAFAQFLRALAKETSGKRNTD